MPEMTVEQLTTDEEWDEAVPILRQLWSHEDEAFVWSWREEEEYQLYGYFLENGGEDRELVAVAGVSVQRVLHHRRHAWVHDIVVDEDHRNRGHGTALLEWVEEWADERDCEYVALANVLDNDGALEFYEDNGMEPWGYVVEKELE